MEIMEVQEQISQLGIQMDQQAEANRLSAAVDRKLQQILDLLGVDLRSSPVDHFLCTSGERQEAVLNQTIMWQRKLTEGVNLFSQNKQAGRLIAFGDILRVDCERGLSDRDWLKTDSPVEFDIDDGGLF